MALSIFQRFKFWDSGDAQRSASKLGVAKITQLPNELLLQIRSSLSLISQVCLALTCRTFFSFMGEALGSNEFALPPLRSNRGRDISLGISSRWELLCFLEDSRWLICSQCIKLRPLHSFSESQLGIDRTRRFCAYGLHQGIVEICPCIRLSFGDKLELITELERSREIPPSEDSRFWHECRMVRRRATVVTQAQPVLQEDGSLVFEMQYQVTANSALPTNLSLMEISLFCCPHYSISHLFAIDMMPFPVWTRSCGVCEFSVVDITDDENVTAVENTNEKRYTLKTTRNLGKAGELADETWSKQCDFRFAYLSIYENNRLNGKDQANE